MMAAVDCTSASDLNFFPPAFSSLALKLVVTEKWIFWIFHIQKKW